MDNTHSTDSNSSSEWRQREMGALWKKEGKSQQFYSGFVKINKGTSNEKEVNVVVFLNKLKTNPKAPDLIVYEQSEQPSFINHEKESQAHSVDEVPETFLD